MNREGLYIAVETVERKAGASTTVKRRARGAVAIDKDLAAAAM